MDGETHSEKLRSLISEPRIPVASLSEDVLQSNDTLHLPASQISAIEQVVDSGEQNIGALSKEDKDLDQQILELSARRSACQELQRSLSLLVERHRRLLSPARRIPGEIWSHVFEIATGNDNSTIRLRSKPFDSRKAPLVLTQVCRTWRDIALHNAPRIWATIRLYYDGWESFSLASNYGYLLVQEFLTRSRDVPLTLDFTLKDISSDPNDIHKDIIALLWKESRRWQNVSISQVKQWPQTNDVTKVLFPTNYSRFKTDRFDNLHTLNLRLDSVLPQTLFVGQLAPQFLSLEITSMSTARSILDPSTFEWSRIQSLELRIGGIGPVLNADTTAFIFDAIRLCPGIKKLVLSCDAAFDEDTLNNMQPVHLSELKTLEWVWEGPSLAKLEVPQLDHAELKWGDYPPVFLQTAATNLKKLSLYEFPRHDFLLSAGPITNLEHLEIYASEPEDDEIELFIATLQKLSSPLVSNAAIPFPSLKHLDVTLEDVCWSRPGISRFQSSVLAFCRQVEPPNSRLSQVPSLESFHLDVSDEAIGTFWYESLSQLKRHAPACLEVVLEFELDL